jgi:hypothetical protein
MLRCQYYIVDKKNSGVGVLDKAVKILAAQLPTDWPSPSNSTVWFLGITLADLSLAFAPPNSHPPLAKIVY